MRYVTGLGQPQFADRIPHPLLGHRPLHFRLFALALAEEVSRGTTLREEEGRRSGFCAELVLCSGLCTRQHDEAFRLSRCASAILQNSVRPFSPDPRFLAHEMLSYGP